MAVCPQRSVSICAAARAMASAPAPGATVMTSRIGLLGNPAGLFCANAGLLQARYAISAPASQRGTFVFVRFMAIPPRMFIVLLRQRDQFSFSIRRVVDAVPTLYI